MRTIQKKLAMILAVILCLGLGAVTASAAPEATMEETVILDNELVTLTVTGYDPAANWGPAFEILMENKSDQPLRVRIDNTAVNGLMCYGYFSEQVPAGKKVYGSLDWDTEDLTFSGINYIETVDAVVKVTNDNYDTLATENVSWSVNVAETDVPAVETPAFSIDPFPVLTDDVVFTIMDYDPQGAYDDCPQLVVYMENHTDSVVSFDVEDVTLNGFVCEPYWGETVTPGMAAYSAIEWSSDSMAESHVDSVQSIGFTVEARDDDTWDVLGTTSVDVKVGEQTEEASGAAEGTVLLDDETATVTVTDFKPDGTWGPAFEILVENKTDKNLRVTMDNVSLNGIMCGYFSQDVPAGMKGYGELDWDYEELETYGINYVQTVKGLLDVYDADTYDDIVLMDVEWSVEPEQPDVPAVEPAEFASGMEPQVILEGDLAASLVDFEPTGYLDESPLLYVYVENKTDKTVRFSVDDLAINGFMIDPSNSETVTPGAAAYIRVIIRTDDLEESHIETVEELELTVAVKDEDTWDDLTSATATVDLTGAAA